MIENIKPYKIDVGDTIIFSGIRKYQDEIYDQNDMDLVGHRFLVSNITYHDEDGIFDLDLLCNMCERIHQTSVRDDDMNNMFVTVFKDDSKSYELYEELY